MIALLFAALSFSEQVAKALNIPPAAFERSIRNIGDEEFVTVVLKWETNEQCAIFKPCRGKWSVERSKDQFPPSFLGPHSPFAHMDPFYLVLVALDKNDVPLWFGTVDDFRILEVPPSPDGKEGFSHVLIGAASYSIDIPKKIGVAKLRIYTPGLDLSGTAKLPVLP